MEPEATPRLGLSSLLMSPSDLSHVRRELSALDEYLRAQALRQAGTPMPRLPKLSRMLDELAEINKLNLLHEDVRARLGEFIDVIMQQAPVLHLSFASDPSSGTLQKIVVWLRHNIDPNALVHVGLQPGIVAGCTLRTTNRYFDFSLRKHLQEQRPFLLDALTPRAQPAPTEANDER